MVKTFCYSLLLAAWSIATSLPSMGQITITAGDVGTTLAPGSTTLARNDTSTHTADIGALGSTAWDFSGFVNNFSAMVVCVRPDTTPMSGFFPDATHAISFGAGVTYYKLGTNLELLGNGQPPPNQVRIVDIPAQVIQQLPMTMGTSWTATYAESSYVTISGVTYASVTNHVVMNTVDAYGSLTLPGGSVYDALRLKTDRRVTTGSFSVRLISYQFLTKEGVSASVVAADTNQPQTGPISASNVSWSTPGTATAVEERGGGGAIPAGVALEQNYPNPFNPSTTIRFSVAEQSFVRLTVYSLHGQELATLVSEQLSPGEFSVEWDGSGLPSGVYVYRLQSGGSVETRKLVLLR